eukprot:scaffold8700_cov62-Phaeocystis_antarctica.AAC.8
MCLQSCCSLQRSSRVTWYLCAAASTACSCAILCTSEDWQAAKAAEAAEAAKAAEAAEAAEAAAEKAAAEEGGVAAVAGSEARPSSSTFSTCAKSSRKRRHVAHRDRARCALAHAVGESRAEDRRAQAEEDRVAREVHGWRLPVGCLESEVTRHATGQQREQLFGERRRRHLDVARTLRQVVRDPSDDVAVARVFGVLLHRAFLDDHLEGDRVVLHPLAAQEVLEAQAEEALSSSAPLGSRGRAALHIGADDAAPRRLAERDRLDGEAPRRSERHELPVGTPHQEGDVQVGAVVPSLTHQRQGAAGVRLDELEAVGARLWPYAREARGCSRMQGARLLEAAALGTEDEHEPTVVVLRVHLEWVARRALPLLVLERARQPREPGELPDHAAFAHVAAVREAASRVRINLGAASVVRERGGARAARVVRLVLGGHEIAILGS